MLQSLKISINRCDSVLRCSLGTMLKNVNSIALLVLAVFAAGGAFAHGAEKPLFVAADGVDYGQCQDASNPCRTIGYAMRWVGKGGQIRVAKGQYEITSGEDLFHLLGGVFDVRGGFEPASGFQDAAAAPSTLIGAPEKYRDQLRKQGFHIVTDGKAGNPSVTAAAENLLQQHETLKSSMPAAPCENGKADLLDCEQVDLLSHVAFADVSSNPVSGADIWGFVDLNTSREYAFVGYNIGTAVFDVTDAENPREVGFIDGQDTVWRDIKVYQYWNSATNRFDAYAYVTSDGANDGLFVVDLTGLPQRVIRVENPDQSFAAAHNVLATNTDFGTGLSLTGATPTLIIAGADNENGRFQSYLLSSPRSPTRIDRALSTVDGYMHDAASMIVTDDRKSQCSATVDYCEILFDFNVNTVDLWDITNPAEPGYLSSASYGEAEYIHSGWVSEDRQFLLVHDELDEIRRGDVQRTTVRVFSLADLLTPVLAGAWVGDTEEVDHNGFTRGNRYYMSNYSRGLSILDLTLPQSPTLVGYLDTYPGQSVNTIGAWGAYPFFHSGNIAVSDINSGFYMLADRTLDVAQGRLAFTSSAYGGDEGSQLEIAVQRIGGTSGNVSVDFEIVPASASAADVISNSGTLSWAAGDAGERTIVLNLVQDEDTDLERLLIKLVAPSGGATLDYQNVASVYISEPGIQSRIGFSTDLIEVAEQGFRTAVAVLQRSGSAIGAASVDYAVSGGDALSGTDYTGATSGTVAWADGDADPKWIEFTIADDSVGENTEFFEVMLSNAVGTNVDIGSQATLKIEIIDTSGVEAPVPPVVEPRQSSGGGAVGILYLALLLAASFSYTAIHAGDRGRPIRMDAV